MRHNPRPKYKKGYIFRRPNGNIYRVDRSYICNHGFPMYHVDQFGGPDQVLKGPLWKAMHNAFFENMIDKSDPVSAREIRKMCANV